MKCNRCGAELEIGAEFCDNCGSRVDKSALSENEQENDISYADNQSTVDEDSLNIKCISDDFQKDSYKSKAGAFFQNIRLNLDHTMHKSKQAKKPLDDSKIIPILAAAVAILSVVLILVLVLSLTKTGPFKQDNNMGLTTDSVMAEAVMPVMEQQSEINEKSVAGTTAETEGVMAEVKSDINVENDIIEEDYSVNDNTYQEGIHDYQVIEADCTWLDAYDRCIESGGHLVTFETDDEYDYVKDLLSNNSKGTVYYIGGKYDNDGYYWIVPDNKSTGDILDGQEYWLPGEPSYVDENGIKEEYMCMLYIKSDDKWGWNDIPNDVISVAANYKGILGYVCEFESIDEHDHEIRDIDNHDQSDDYILPDSALRYYNSNELASLSKDELRIARNEIYARHGRIFNDDELRAYFMSKEWYEPRTEEVSESELNDYEKNNRDLIKELENQ